MSRRHIKQLAKAMKRSARLLGCLAGMLGFSCSSVPTTVDPSYSFPVSFSLVFVIHGDGDYLYHDREGTAYRADDRMLAEAELVAAKNPHAEVFIFHEKPKSNFLLFFPQRDGDFSYYRNGSLIGNESYRRDKPGFAAQAELYRRFRQPSRDVVKMFFYFGHEIPEVDGKGYDASYPERSFSVHDLKSMLAQLSTDSAKFDIAVLSTCFNGTPYTVANVGSYARYIVASPDNLHLSYFDIGSLRELETTLSRQNVSDFARQFAQHAFERLTPEIQTAITVVMYDVHQVNDYVRAVTPMYVERLASFKNTPALAEHCDCADEPVFASPEMSNGVTILYRPARFGRAKNKPTHSGWECWTIADPSQHN